MCRKPFMATQAGFPREHRAKGLPCVGAEFLPPQTPEPYPEGSAEPERKVAARKALTPLTERQKYDPYTRGRLASRMRYRGLPSKGLSVEQMYAALEADNLDIDTLQDQATQPT